MKNLTKLFGTQSRMFCAIALVAVIGLSMAGCKQDVTAPILGTVTYRGIVDGSDIKLVITEGARYAAKNGDSYVLTVTKDGITKTSSGTVNVSGTTLTLTPTGTTTTFTITINPSSSAITDVNLGQIIYTDGSIITNGDGSITIKVPVAGAGSANNFSYVDHGDTNPAALNTVHDGAASVTINNGIVTISLGKPKSYFLSTSSITNMVGTSVASDNSANLYLNNEFCTQNKAFALVVAEGTHNNNVALLGYVDKDVTLNGTFAPPPGLTLTYNNVVLTEGWNYLISRSTGEYTATLTSSKALPSGYKWTVYAKTP